MPFLDLSEAILTEFATATAYTDSARFTNGADEDHEGADGDALSIIGFRDQEKSLGDEWLKAQGERTFQDRGDKLHVSARMARRYMDKKAEIMSYIGRYHQTNAGKAARARATEKQRLKRIAQKKRRDSIRKYEASRRRNRCIKMRELRAKLRAAGAVVAVPGRPPHDYTHTILRGGSIVLRREGQVPVGLASYPKWIVRCRCRTEFERSSCAIRTSIAKQTEPVCDACSYRRIVNRRRAA